MPKDSSRDKTKDLKKRVIVSEKLMKIRPKRVDRRSMIISKFKRRALKHLWVVRAALLAVALIAIYLLFTLLGTVVKKTDIGFYFRIARDFIFTPQEKIESISDRTNILILGKGGVGHEAPDLTDTIIFASLKHQTPSISLISLSRDIWIPELRAKLNSTYYWGNQKQEKGGLILAKATVEKIVGEHVHYGVVIDFSGFKNIIDTLDGIEVEVENSFIDKRYPILGRENDDCEGRDPEFLCRYETIEFKKGNQMMDGETALKFARSRNAEGDEGTDFARAKRQQKVIASIRNRALSREIVMNPKRVVRVIRSVRESIETDIDPSALAILARRILDARDNVSSKVLPEDLLENPPISPRYDKLYVFIPKNDASTEAGHEWDKIHVWVECVLENGECN